MHTIGEWSGQTATSAPSMCHETGWTIGIEVRRPQRLWIRSIEQMCLKRILWREQFQSYTETWFEVWHILVHHFSGIDMVDIAVFARNITRLTLVLLLWWGILDRNIIFMECLG